MLTPRYLTSVKNLSSILQKIVQGTAPEKFTVEHLRSIGFGSSNDRAVIPLLKDLGFLTADGSPTQRYLDYRDGSRSRSVLGEALKDAYSDVFHVSEKPTDADRGAIEGKFKSALNSSDRVAEAQALTFMSLLKLADMHANSSTKQKEDKVVEPVPTPTTDKSPESTENFGLSTRVVDLRYNVEIHLPPSKDPEVFNAIFKALKEHLLG